MKLFTRYNKNPILKADKEHIWEQKAAYNPCVIKDGGQYHLLYRAESLPTKRDGYTLALSSIGYAKSTDGINFQDRRQLILPEFDWERFGCEDPRVTKIGDKFYIFYTALAGYPFSKDNIRIGIAITKDFKTIDAKHSVTTFNSKAMALFPEKIKDRYAALLTVHTDMPPAKIVLAYFDQERQIWSEQHWAEWYSSLDSHVIPLLKSSQDHLELGAPPIKTKDGWLVIYSYIKNYFKSEKSFGIEAVLLDLEDPQKVLGRTTETLMVPESDYETKGNVPNIIFPGGALIDNDNKLRIYYGAADTSCCMAEGALDPLLDILKPKGAPTFLTSKECPQAMMRFAKNPIISPRPEFDWEAKATFNPAVIYEDGKVHIVYRAMGFNNTSVFGYASSLDGVTIHERLTEPIFEPTESFEQKRHPGNSGCEDPRLTKIGDRLYLFYTAFDGDLPRVAFSSIEMSDFLKKQWNWAKPKAISPAGIQDKDACLLPKMIENKYLIFHRIAGSICMSFVGDLLFKKDVLTQGLSLLRPTAGNLHILKVGMAGPPIETEHGWIMIYHWITDQPVRTYEIGAILLCLDDAAQMISNCSVTLLKPELEYEKHGLVDNVVFSCGAVVIEDYLYLYYGAADEVCAVARMKLQDIVDQLKEKGHGKLCT